VVPFTLVALRQSDAARKTILDAIRGTGQERAIAQPKLEKLPRVDPVGLDDVERTVFSRDGRSVALIGRGWVQVVEVASGNRLFKESSARVACEFAPDGQSLAVVREVRARAIQVGNAHSRGLEAGEGGEGLGSAAATGLGLGAGAFNGSRVLISRSRSLSVVRISRVSPLSTSL